MKNYSKKNNLAFEEILLDKHLVSRTSSLEKLESPITDFNILKFSVFVFISLLVIFSRLFFLNILKGNENFKISEANRLRYVLIKAPRGIIYDRYQKPIVANKTSLSLILLPRDFFNKDEDKKEKLLKDITRVFELDLSDLELITKKLTLASYEPVLIKTNISPDMARGFESEIPLNDRFGFYVIEDYTRAYSDKEAFSHVVGYIGRMTDKDQEKYPDYPIADLIGKYGLESYYEKYLHGVSGKKLLEVDAQSKMNPNLGIENPETGNMMMTTIDRDLQKFLYDALMRSVVKLNIHKASAIMTNPQTGEVLAMVSIPSIDVEAFSIGSPVNIIKNTLNNKYNPFTNRIISGLYSPGSTIKPLVALAALMEKTINPDDNMKDADAIIIPNKYDPAHPSKFKDWRNHTVVNMRTAIAYSCNIYFYALGGGYKNIQGLGITRLKKYWQMFHLAQKLGIDLANEENGILPDPENKKRTNKSEPGWYLGDTYNASIGQGDLSITPLQIAYYIASIANNGKIMKPFIVSKIINSKNEIVYQNKPEVITKLNIPTEYFDIVRDGMRKVITMGSGQLMKTIPMEVAGKTGTPQTQNSKSTNALFCGFAPYQNPEVLILVMLEEPPEGSVVTIPLVDEVMRYYYNNRFLHKETADPLSPLNPKEGTTSTTQN